MLTAMSASCSTRLASSTASCRPLPPAFSRATSFAPPGRSNRPRRAVVKAEFDVDNASILVAGERMMGDSLDARRRRLFGSAAPLTLAHRDAHQPTVYPLQVAAAVRCKSPSGSRTQARGCGSCSARTSAGEGVASSLVFPRACCPGAFTHPFLKGLSVSGCLCTVQKGD